MTTDQTPSDPTTGPSDTNGSAPTPDGREHFAADLRELRITAGSPTLAALGHRTGVSKTVLSEAFAGRRLPSARTVAAIVTAFDGDVRTWVRRRDAIDAADASTTAPTAARPTGAATGAPAGPPTGTADDSGPSTDDGVGATPAPSTDTGTSGIPGHATAATTDVAAPHHPARKMLARRTAVLMAAAAFVVGALVSGVVTGTMLSGRESAIAGESPTPRALSTGNAAPKYAVANGSDPANTKCVDDAKVVASETRTNNTQLQIIYSADCHAAWSRITRYDDLSSGNEISTSIYRQIAPNAKDRQSTTEPDAQSAYTTLLVRPTPTTRLCTVGSITVAGKTIDLGAPLCL